MLQADETLFQTGWFVESLCTQVLVIFVIRTRGNPLKSRAHPLLAATSLAVVAIARAVAVYADGNVFRIRAAARQVLLHPRRRWWWSICSLVELAKRGFYRWATARK